jgi:tetratricopeptide (TPR) repeat protein
MKSLGTFIWHLVSLLISLSLLGWVLFHWLKKSDERGALIGRWIVTAVLVVVLGGIGFQAKDEISAIFAILSGAVGGLVLAILWVPSVCDFVAGQFASLYDGGDLEVEPQPFYSIAEAKRKQGKYLDAQAEIRGQLNRFPNDFQGWMLLAEIQAEDMHDLATAQETVERILSQEDHLPMNRAFALNRLADWHLKISQDPDSARAALERILELLPNTEQAQLAHQRIAHLASGKSLVEKHHRPTIAVRHYEESIGLRTDYSDLRPPPEDLAKMAGDYVKHLEQYPQDNEAREKLALIYADHYQRLDLAAQELEQLIATPNQLAKHVVHWLNLLADLQIKLAGDAALARQTLQRIADGFPKTAAAENAIHRLAHLGLELRTKEKSQVVKLGSYEQNIGLKGKSG